MARQDGSNRAARRKLGGEGKGGGGEGTWEKDGQELDERSDARRASSGPVCAQESLRERRGWLLRRSRVPPSSCVAARRTTERRERQAGGTGEKGTRGQWHQAGPDATRGDTKQATFRARWWRASPQSGTYIRMCACWGAEPPHGRARAGERSLRTDGRVRRNGAFVPSSARAASPPKNAAASGSKGTRHVAVGAR